TKSTSQVQRQAEEEEEIQTKSTSQVQRQAEEEEEEEAEEEEELQTKSSQVQRQVEEEEEEELQTKSLLQRQEVPEEEEEIQTKPAGSQPTTVSEHLESRIKAERGSGHPLSDDAREPMEHAFGADFSGVRVHTDSEADALNKQLSAKAFTTGQDVFFRENEYSPGSGSGRELIAHELTHVVQQTGGENQSGQVVQRFLSDDDLGKLGITKEQYARFNAGEKKYIEGLFSGGNLDAAKDQAQELLKAREQRRAAAQARKQRRVATTGVVGPTKPALQPPRPLVRPTKPLGPPTPAPVPPGAKVEATTGVGRPTKPPEPPTGPAPVPPGAKVEAPKTKAKTPWFKGARPMGAPTKVSLPQYNVIKVEQANSITASLGGRGGIFFLKDKRQRGGVIVVKFEPAEAVRGKFAETLLAEAGFQTTKSQVYPISSPEGQRVKSKVNALIKDPESCPKDPNKLVRLQEVGNKIQDGQAVLVSDFIPSTGGALGELLTEPRKPEEKEKWAKNIPVKQLGEAFNDFINAETLGRLLVYDAFLGNQDRLEAGNLANVMLSMRGGSWRFVLIDNAAEVQTMKGNIEAQMEKTSMNYFTRGQQREKITKQLTVADWVTKLIEGGEGIEVSKTAQLKFLENTQKAATDTIQDLKEKYFLKFDKKTPIEAVEPVLKAIDWGKLVHGVELGIRVAAIDIQRTSSKHLKKLYKETTKSLGAGEFLSLYGLRLKRKYVGLIMGKKKMTHQAAMAILTKMASKKMKDLTGSADYVLSEIGVPERESEIQTY
ncbi:MAG: DUF4157 domain-containing protein, partial [Candidatus Bathyarchaeota archaeon]|nr:DUF4157 domain-containing protein [Candidatus Bathyarchaeota archaeon]